MMHLPHFASVIHSGLRWAWIPSTKCLQPERNVYRWRRKRNNRRWIPSLSPRLPLSFKLLLPTWGICFYPCSLLPVHRLGYPTPPHPTHPPSNTSSSCYPVYQTFERHIQSEGLTHCGCLFLSWFSHYCCYIQPDTPQPHTACPVFSPHSSLVQHPSELWKVLQAIFTPVQIISETHFYCFSHLKVAHWEQQGRCSKTLWLLGSVLRIFNYWCIFFSTAFVTTGKGCACLM